MAKSRKQSKKSSSRPKTKRGPSVTSIYLADLPPRRKHQVKFLPIDQADDHSID